MRLDDYLSTVGIVKRRTIAKELASNGLVLINDRRAKPAAQVRVGDVIEVKGTRPSKAEVLDIPSGSVAKDRREQYYRSLAIG